MRILIVDSFFRIRDLKLVHSLKEVYGKKIDFVLAKTTDRTDNEKYIPKMKVYRIDSRNKPIDQLIQICKKHKINVLHTHNYPDTYGFWGLKVRDKLKIPVVHECHDIGYHNTSASSAQLSDIVMKGVDQIVTVGPGMNDYLEKRYKVGNKCNIVYAYPNKAFLPKIKETVPDKYYNGVYQGGINMAVVEGSPYNHRYYGGIFKRLSEQGLKIDVYPARPMKRGYNINNVRFKNNIPDIKDLYSAISRYSFEFVGYNPTPSEVLNMAYPNKQFEAIGCGIPLLAMDYDRIASFVRDNGFGIVIDKHTLKLSGGFHDKMKEAKKMVLKRRTEYTMEKQAPAIYEMYQEALN